MIKLNIFGINDVSTGISYNNLGNIYLKKSNYIKAENFFQKAYIIFIDKLGKAHPHTKFIEKKLKEINDQ